MISKKSENQDPTPGLASDRHRKFFIHAPNIHQGGGRSLLTALFNRMSREVESTFILDPRMPVPDMTAAVNKIRLIKPTVLRRFFAELWLGNGVKRGDIVLCLGNLPPLFRLRGHTIVYLQNRYLVEYVRLSGFSVRQFLRITFERIFLRCRAMNADEFFVQTPTMKTFLETITRGRVPVRIVPFVGDPMEYARHWMSDGIHAKPKDDFLYIASGEGHKNHRRLVESWCALANEGIFPRLTLTVGRADFPELCSWIDKKIEQFRLRIKNLDVVPHEQIHSLYSQAGALIYPSTLESFGLPLVEARQAGIPILASELDYVRDIVDPEQTFDPLSVISITRAVKRFMEIAEPPLPLTDAGDFIAGILEGRQ